jgi:hypothetical protein
MSVGSFSPRKSHTISLMAWGTALDILNSMKAKQCF